MKEYNISQLGDYDSPFCEQQYTHGSCYIFLFKFKSFDQLIPPQTASNFRHLLSCGTIDLLKQCPGSSVQITDTIVRLYAQMTTPRFCLGKEVMVVLLFSGTCLTMILYLEPLSGIDCDCIVGIKCNFPNLLSFFVLAVYLPSSNHHDEDFSEYLIYFGLCTIPCLLKVLWLSWARPKCRHGKCYW